MEQWKTNKTYKFIGLAVLVALPFIGWYLGTRSTGNTETQTPATGGETAATSSPSAEGGQIKKPLTYTEAVSLYKNTRIQFDAACHATPAQMSLKNGTTIMLDNRFPQTRSIHVDDVDYTISGYGFKLAKLSSSRLPHTVRIDCGNGKNNAQVFLQK